MERRGPVAVLTVPVDQKELQREVDMIIAWNKDLIYLWAMDVPLDSILRRKKPSIGATMKLMFKNGLFMDALDTLNTKQPEIDSQSRILAGSHIVEELTKFALDTIVKENRHE